MAMSALQVSVVICCCAFGAGVVGLVLSPRLPDHHRDNDSRDVVKLVMGLIATVAALVLGLLISTAHTSFVQQQTEIQHLGVKLIQLNRALETFGADSMATRVELRRIVVADSARLWPVDHSMAVTIQTTQEQIALEDLFRRIQDLPATTDAQRAARARAFQLLTDVGETRRLLDEQANGSISWPFLVILVFWLCVLFLGFGLFARLNATVLVALLLGAMSVAGAIFLILEMNRPYNGVMRVSDAPIRSALSVMSP
jgi:hypothetical protein